MNLAYLNKLLLNKKLLAGGIAAVIAMGVSNNDIIQWQDDGQLDEFVVQDEQRPDQKAPLDVAVNEGRVFAVNFGYDDFDQDPLTLAEFAQYESESNDFSLQGGKSPRSDNSTGDANNTPTPAGNGGGNAPILALGGPTGSTTNGPLGTSGPTNPNGSNTPNQNTPEGNPNGDVPPSGDLTPSSPTVSISNPEKDCEVNCGSLPPEGQPVSGPESSCEPNCTPITDVPDPQGTSCPIGEVCLDPSSENPEPTPTPEDVCVKDPVKCDVPPLNPSEDPKSPSEDDEQNRSSQVPEPSTLLLFALGLIACTRLRTKGLSK